MSDRGEPGSGVGDGLSSAERRFALVVSSAHFSQHAYYRILPPLIPVLAVALEYPLWQLGLLITCYTAAMGLAQAPLGILSDRVDRRYLLPTGLGLTGAAYVAFAFAQQFGASLPAVPVLGHSFDGGFLVMATAMSVVGVGLAVVHPAGYPMITDNVRSANKGKVLGVFGASSKLGDAATPAIIAVAILVLSWQQVILLFGVAGILYAVGLYAVLGSGAYETLPTVRQGEGSDEPSRDVRSIDRRSFLYPITAIYLFFFSTGLATRGLNTFLPAFIVAVYAYSVDIGGIHLGAESVANVYFAGLLVAGAAFQLILGRVTDRYDPRRILLACMGVGTVGLIVLAAFDLHPLLLFVVVAVLGTGLYGVNPARDALISDLSPPEYEGRTFGYMFTAVSLTGAPLPALIGYLLESVGMRTGFLLLAAGPVLASVFVALLYSERVYRATPDTPASAGKAD